MGRRRLSADGHKMTHTEIKRRADDRAASIDLELEQAFKNIDWERRNTASKSFVDFINTYFIGLMIDDPPSKMFVNVLKQIEFSLMQSTPQNTELPRGTGKTSAAEMAILYLIATGRRKFCVIVAQNGRSAANILKDIWRPIMEKDTAFAQDFPEICLPFQVTNGSFRRRQLYRGVSTDLEKNSQIIHFARLLDKDGNELPTSGSAITVRGVTSGVRGLKIGKMRPDTVLLDDLQSAESATSPEQVAKIRDIINKDILNLSSKGKLTVLMTSTPIVPDDLCDKIEHDVNWKTTKYKAMLKWPKDIIEHKDDGLWAQYFKLYDAESVNNKTHEESLEFYKKNKSAMDEGAELFNPDRFKTEDGHISGLQALLEKRHMIGAAAFMSEYQMQPMKTHYSLDISPSVVLSKKNTFERLQVPDGFNHVACGIDLNTTYAITVSITAFKLDMTACVLYHNLFKCNIDQQFSDTQYNAAVYNKLVEVCKEIKSLGIHINGVAIDAGGKNWDAVCDFCKNSMSLVGLPCCAFAGRSANLFNPFVRSRLRNAVGRTVLCGNDEERVKSGAGQKYMFFDADLMKEMVQRAFLNQVGAAGSCSLYNADDDEHIDFCQQVCNEKLSYVNHKADGRDEYVWKTLEPHDYCDTMAMCYAVATSEGLGGMNFTRPTGKPKFVKKTIPRKKIVIR